MKTTKNNIDKLNKIFLNVKSDIGNINCIEDLKIYEERKQENLRLIEDIKCSSSDELVLMDKIKIYYRFCDNKIIPELYKGKCYRFIK